MLYGLILAGGKGTRLYPLSRKDYPKQFLKIINDKSFLTNTFDRIKKFVPVENIFIVTNEDYYEKVKEDVPLVSHDNIFLEPQNKETATCIGYACAKLFKKDPESCLMVFPSDHFIENENEFESTIKKAIEIAEKKRGLVTIGVKPDRAETGFGYIEMGRVIDDEIYKVERFTEKPNTEVAKDFLIKGNYLWNSGIFVWRCDVFLREMEKYTQKIYKHIMKIYEAIGQENEDKVLREEYNEINGISVDFGILQRTRKGYVVKSNFIWDDIGTFHAVTKFLENKSGNAIKGNILLEDTENCTIINNDKLLISFGIQNLIIITTKDVVLIMDKSKEQEVKYLVNTIQNNENLNGYL